MAKLFLGVEELSGL